MTASNIEETSTRAGWLREVREAENDLDAARATLPTMPVGTPGRVILEKFITATVDHLLHCRAMAARAR